VGVLVVVGVAQGARHPCQDDDTIRCVLSGNRTQVRYLTRATHVGQPVPFSFDIYSKDFDESDLSTHLRVRMDGVFEVDVRNLANSGTPTHQNSLQPASAKQNQKIDIFAPIEMWNTTLAADRYILSVDQAPRGDPCSLSPNAPLCVNFNVDNTLLNEDREITVPGPSSRVILKSGSLFVRTTITGWDWVTPNSVLEIYFDIRVTSLLSGEVESIIVADKPLTTNYTSPTTVSFRVITTHAAFDMSFYGNAADTFTIVPKPATVKLQSPQSQNPYAWTYTVRPLSKAELNTTRGSDDLTSIGGSPYILYTLIGAGVVILIICVVGLICCAVRRSKGKKEHKSNRSSRA
jgi:hypothetical protein